MSIVGTRPPLISETNLYELHHRARLAIKPGITGMWQVSGRSDITDFEEVVRLRYDLFDINKEEKIIEYDVCLINGQKYNVKVIAERVEEEIMGVIFTDSRRISETQRFNIVRVRNPRILASFYVQFTSYPVIGDGDLWLFWCPRWHFIKNRLIMIASATGLVFIINRQLPDN